MSELNATDLERLRSLIDAFSAGDDSKVGEIFTLIDRNGNGRIEASELQTVMSQVIGERLTEADVAEMIQDADANKNGVIELNEFIEIMKKDRDS